jgi:hypothetical protein
MRPRSIPRASSVMSVRTLGSAGENSTCRYEASMRRLWRLAFPLVLAACGGTLGDIATMRADAGVDSGVDSDAEGADSGADSTVDTGVDTGCAPCVLNASTLGACCLR